MRSRLSLVAALLLLLSSNAFGQGAPPPDGPGAPNPKQLIDDWQTLQNGLTHVARGLEEYIQGSQRYVAQMHAESEAQKATLIEWLKAAQAEAAAKEVKPTAERK